MSDANNKSSLAVPVAIVISALIIAGALYFSLGKKAAQAPSANNAPAKVVKVPGVQKNDHILGSPNAKVVIVEYSDTECPFCKAHHETLNKVIEKYGKSGKVAWVYRALPLEQLHPKAPKEAQAGECVAKLGGEGAFWKFINKIYKETPSNNKLDLAKLPEFAKFAGVNVTEFNKCLDSDYGKDIIKKHLDDAIKATGGRIGTPHNVLLVGDKQIPVAGYLPFENMDKLLNQLFKQAK